MALNQRTVLVTGANRGLGLEVCRQLADLGHRVILTSRTRSKADVAVAALKREQSARTLEALELDVRSAASIEAAVQAIAERRGEIDTLINNAGVHYDTQQTASTASFAVVEEAIATNLMGAWRVTLAMLPFMGKRQHGIIVNVSSGAGAINSIGAGTPAYCVSKAGLNALTIALAADLKSRNILVNAVCPGWVATDMGGAGGRPVPDGARGIVWASTLPPRGPTGEFFRNRRRLRWSAG